MKVQFKSKGCMGGVVKFCTYYSKSLDSETNFTVFIPGGVTGKIPYIMTLAGLGCNDKTFLIKSNIIQFAAKHGIGLIAPDTSPRDTGLDPHPDTYWVGEGAGYYVNADKPPYNKHFKMHDWVSKELPELAEKEFNFDLNCKSITGHSMGGLGALMLGLKYPDEWKSVSAFAPATCAVKSDWSEDAAVLYFENPEQSWKEFSPSLLLKEGKKRKTPLLIDQGLEDEFFDKLGTNEFAEIANDAGQELILRKHEDYDHSYWFIQTFIESHVSFHALYLKK